MIRLLLYSLLVLAINASPVYAKRYALVIGNSDYGEKIGFLKNPVNDANDMALSLREKNFNVTKLINASQREMEEGISKFTKKLHNKNAVGLFFFAGHGMGLHGSNYLIPIGANVDGENDVKYEAVDAERVMSGMQYAGNNLNMVILDACRNNPFTRSFRSVSRGLIRVSPPKGSLILYATSPGDVAADGSGRNGVFTQHLLTAMNTTNANVEQVFKETANKVYNATNKKQLPWQSGVILGEFYFSGQNDTTVSSVKSEEINFLDSRKSRESLSSILGLITIGTDKEYIDNVLGVGRKNDFEYVYSKNDFIMYVEYENNKAVRISLVPKTIKFSNEVDIGRIAYKDKLLLSNATISDFVGISDLKSISYNAGGSGNCVNSASYTYQYKVHKMAIPYNIDVGHQAGDCMDDLGNSNHIFSKKSEEIISKVVWGGDPKLLLQVKINYITFYK